MKNSIKLGLILTVFSSAAIADDHMQKSGMGDAKEPMKQEMREKMKERMHNRSEYMWNELDANNDGFISKEESNAYSNKKFEEKDADKDGKVTKEEWEAHRKAKMEKMKEKHKEMKKNMNGDDKK